MSILKSPAGRPRGTLGRVAPMSSRPNFVLATLFVVYIFNFIDRQILSILLQSIKEELQVSDAYMGFLTGTAFAIFYTTMGIPIARWADRGTRTTVIAVGLAVWSGMTALSGLVRTFWQLAVARILLGVGEAAASPASHSLLSDYFPPERRATALAIYTMGANVGILIALAGGGWIDQAFGWRMAFFVVGAPGLVLALVVRLAIKEPPRGQVEGLATDADMPTVGEVFAHLWRSRSFRHLSIASGLYAFAGYGFMTWVPTFLIRVHEMSRGEAGTWTGLMVGGGGALGAYLGGRLADGLGADDARWSMWICAIGGVAMTPLAAAFLLSSDPTAALFAYAPAAVLGSLYVGPTFAVTQALAKLRMRALASAVILFFLNLIGLGLGPWAVGISNDLLAPRFGDEAVRYSLLLAIALNGWAAVHSVIGARTLRSDLAALRD